MRDILSGHSIVFATKEQVSCILAEDIVILNLRHGTYHGLNPVAARIWNLIQKPIIINEIRDAILNEYDVGPEQCERDLMQLLQELIEVGLIEVRNETSI